MGVCSYEEAGKQPPQRQRVADGRIDERLHALEEECGTGQPRIGSFIVRALAKRFARAFPAKHKQALEAAVCGFPGLR